MQERRLTTKYCERDIGVTDTSDTTLETIARCTKSPEIFPPFETTNKFRKAVGKSNAKIFP